MERADKGIIIGATYRHEPMALHLNLTRSICLTLEGFRVQGPATAASRISGGEGGDRRDLRVQGQSTDDKGPQ